MGARWAGLLHWADLLLILFVLWIVYVIREPGRKQERVEREREKLGRWSLELARDRSVEVKEPTQAERLARGRRDREAWRRRTEARDRRFGW